MDRKLERITPHARGQLQRERRRSRTAAWRLGLAVCFAFAGMMAVLASGIVADAGLLAVPSASAQNATSYATEVASFTPGRYSVDDSTCIPNNQGGTASSILGAPDDPASSGDIAATTLSASIGFGGQIVVNFSEPAAGDGDTSTADIWVWESGSFAEPYQVEVFDDDLGWVVVGVSDQQTNGSQGFDIDHAGFDETSRVFSVRITDLDVDSIQSCPGNANDEGFYPSGSDIDAVGVITPALPAELEIEKVADPASGVNEGDTITYTFTATNTGDTPLTGVTIVDPLPGLTWVTGPGVGDLAPGESGTASATYVVTEEDILNGGVTNTATGTCAEFCSPPPITVIVPPADPELVLEKVADPASGVVEGDTITYTFTVTNTGDVTLYGVIIDDPLPGLTWVTGPEVGDLAPGESTTGTATYIVTADDITNGGVTNTATATCENTCTPPPITVIVPPADPGLVLEKSADPASGVIEGDTITYTFTATNTGDVPLTNVTIDDPLPGLTWVTGPEVGDLAPGESASGTATYVVTAEDVLNGGVTNTATATCSEVCDPPPVTVIVPPLDPDPDPGQLVLDKSADAAGEVHPGDLITYTFVVTNTGGTAVENVTVSDPLPGLGPIEGPHGITLAPGESTTFTATYPVTESDAIAGEIDNTATATGTGVDGSTLTDDDDVVLEACDPGAGAEPTETPGPGTPEADDDADADAESQFGAAATCTGIVEPNPDPTDPPSEPRPTSPPSNGGGNSGGGGGGGGGGPIVKLPSTGQSGQADASVLGSPLVAGLLIALVTLFGIALRLQVRRNRG